MLVCLRRSIKNPPKSDSRTKGSVPLSIKTAGENTFVVWAPLKYLFYSVFFSICCSGGNSSISSVKMSAV
jgi:hypothetical protein